MALIEQAFKMQSSPTPPARKPVWTLETVKTLLEVATDAFAAQTIKYTPSDYSFQVHAAKVPAEIPPATAAMSSRVFFNRIVDKMKQNTRLTIMPEAVQLVAEAAVDSASHVSIPPIPEKVSVSQENEVQTFMIFSSVTEYCRRHILAWT